MRTCCWMVLSGVIALEGLACRTESSSPPASVSLDSAGVTVITYSQLGSRSWAKVHRCRKYTGTGERGRDARSAAFLAGGGVAMVNSITAQIDLFDSAGGFRFSLGHSKRRRGEFGDLSWIRSVADTLIAFDPNARRLFYFDVRGTLTRSITLAGDWLPTAQVLGPLSNHQWLEVRTGTAFRPDDELPGPRRSMREYVLLDPNGSIVDTLGRYAQAEVVRTMVRGTERTFVLDVPPPFGRHTYTASTAAGFIVADNETFNVRFFDTRGRLMRILRIAAPPRRVRPADIAAYIDAAEESGKSRVRTARRRLLESAPTRDTWPAHGEIVVAANDEIWVSEYALPGHHGRHWNVFSDTGSFLGTALTPPHLSILEVGRKALLGREVEHSGAEFVVSCEIVRTGS